MVKGISATMVRSIRSRKIEECQAAMQGQQAHFLRSKVRQEVVDLLEVRRALRAVVEEALRACLFGRVIARSAKIEAGWNPESQVLLSTLASEFEAELGSILPSLRTLDTLERRGLS